MDAGAAVHFDLDGGWGAAPGLAPISDVRAWGPRLRFSAPRDVVEEFYEHVKDRLAAYTLYGSGDFHHLTALWIRRVAEPITLISFDNHPDWDTRPPRWACGGWINRALELPWVERASVWGCANFEMDFPWRLFGNRAALRSGRLTIHPWARRPGRPGRGRFAGMTPENWRERFRRFSESLAPRRVYVTIDIDCLRADEAVTNWENGLFQADDLVWALTTLRRSTCLVGGDVCGAYSVPAYARWTQALAGKFDHPSLPVVDAHAARIRNAATLGRIWPALVGADWLGPAGDQRGSAS